MGRLLWRASLLTLAVVLVLAALVALGFWGSCPKHLGNGQRSTRKLLLLSWRGSNLALTVSGLGPSAA
jgi:hypothetical protein